MAEITSQQTGSNARIYSLLIDSQIQDSWYMVAQYFVGNRILHCSKILLESIKVLPESSTVNVR